MFKYTQIITKDYQKSNRVPGVSKKINEDFRYSNGVIKWHHKNDMSHSHTQVHACKRARTHTHTHTQ